MRVRPTLARNLERDDTLTLNCPGWPADLLVRSSDAALLQALHAHLAVALIDCPPRKSSIVLTVYRDAKLLEEFTNALSAGDVSQVAGYLGASWSTAELGDTRVWLSADGSCVVVQAGFDDWAVVTPERAIPAALAVLRICREVIRTRVAALGGIAVHGSLVRVPPLGGVLVVGDAGAGKTTLALWLAQRGGYVVSTDQTYLLPFGVKPWGTTLPNAHRLADGTARLLGVPLAEFEHRLIRGDTRSGPGAGPAGAPGKAWLTAVELHTYFGILSAPTAVIDQVVLAGPAQHLQVASIPTEEVPALMRDHVRQPDLMYPEYWLAPDSALPFLDVDTYLVELAESVPANRLGWDPRRDDVDAAVRQLLPSKSRES